MNEQNPPNPQKDKDQTKDLIFSLLKFLAGTFLGFLGGIATTSDKLLGNPTIAQYIVPGETTLPKVVIG